MRLTLGVLAVAVLLALAWVVITTTWLWRYQERVVFQPPGLAPDAPSPARRVTFAAADGHPVFGYVVAKTDDVASRTVVMAFHGNADLAAWQIPWAQEVVERTGVTVFVPEYRGYAGIPGTPTYETSAADARGALAFARSSLRADDVVLYGHSLGSALAAELAQHMQDAPPRSVLLVSPFTSARDMAARMLVPPVPWLWRRISRVHYDTRAIVSKVSAPVHVAHGSRDINIPVRMGRQVHEAARRRGELLIVEGAGHNDVADVGGERYWLWLTRAIGMTAVTSGR